MKCVACVNCKLHTTVQNIYQGITLHCESCGKVIVKIPANTAWNNNARCAYCGVTIDAGEISVFCPSCGIEYHEECWQDNEGCATYGCEYSGCLKEALATQSNTLNGINSPPPLSSEVGNGIPTPQGMENWSKREFKLPYNTEKVRDYVTHGITCLLYGLDASGRTILPFYAIGKLGQFRSRCYWGAFWFVWVCYTIYKINQRHRQRNSDSTGNGKLE